MKGWLERVQGQPFDDIKGLRLTLDRPQLEREGRISSEGPRFPVGWAGRIWLSWSIPSKRWQREFKLNFDIISRRFLGNC
jgi:hypothetical protein